MALFGSDKPDPKDELIAVLRQSLDHERAMNADLHRQVLALTDRAAYRLVHREAAPGDRPVPSAEPNAYQARAEEYRPDYSLASLEPKD